MTAFCWCVLICAAIPAVMFVCNLMLYRRPGISNASDHFAVSVLIPARNEQATISAAVQSALASTGINLEVIVLDDHSEDETRTVVEAIAASDPRVRVLSAPVLPDRWCGKQFACWVLAGIAKYPLLCFIDADVTLTPDGLARLCAEMKRSKVSLLSGFPHQVVRSPAEQLVIPLMHFILLGFLPMLAMKGTTDPAYSAGCGQLFLADAIAYRQVGGHSAIRASRHDGLKLPRAFREKGLRTGLCDATDIAECRMYQNAREVVDGLLKNATEGIADPKRIIPFTVLLALGQVAPVFLAPFRTIAVVALGLSLLPRILAAARFRQPFLAALCQPLAVIVLLAIQWLALLKSWAGAPSNWKGRSYPAT